MSRSLLLMLLMTAVLGVSGCHSCGRRPAPTRTAVVPGAPCCPPGGVGLPPPPRPVGGPPGAPLVAPPPGFPGAGAPAPAITPVPPGNPPFPPAPPQPMPPAAPLPAAPVPAGPPGSASLSPRIEPNWQPAEGRSEPARVAQAVPDPLLGATGGVAQAAPPAAPKLYPPEVQENRTAEPPLLEEKRKLGGPLGGPPSVTEKKTRATFPAGIPQFTKATVGVWNGQRPSIDDGLDWLAANGYKTVLHLRSPNDPESPDRKQVERLGMTYLSIELSPQTLTREKLDEFAKLVRDVARQPLFVYDQDGALTGPLWYLYFRKVANDDDEVARIKANSLGLREDREGAHRLMWLAVQKYLQANP